MSRAAFKKSKTAKASEPHADKLFEDCVGTREKLLAAALHLFSRQGFKGTSTKQISELAGANTAAITYHFESKELLLNAILAEHVARNSPAMEALLASVQSVDELKLRLRLYASSMLESFARDHEFHRLVRQESQSNPQAFETFRAGLDEFLQKLFRFLKDAKKRGFIRKEIDETFIGYVIFGLIIGARADGTAEKCDASLALSSPKKKERFLEQIMSIIFDGIIES